jgi:hypothetical protein
MRNHLIILLLILTSCNSDKIEKAEFNDFSDIEIRFRTGDERIEFYSMDIFKSGEKFKQLRKVHFTIMVQELTQLGQLKSENLT